MFFFSPSLFHMPITSLLFRLFSQKSESDDSDIKLADFGFAKKVKTPKSLLTQCGTVS